jgi:radical SAM superfamily enzyme YgiQ (UPF0313 family)
MKVVLIHPPMIFGAHRTFGFPPLGPLYIATFLQKKGVDVKLIDSCILGHTLKEIVDLTLKEKPDVVGLALVTSQMKCLLDIAKELKKINPAIKIVVGGPHISTTKDELFKFTKDIDFLIYAEAEYPFYKLVKAIENGTSFEDIDNLIYKKDNKTVINKQAPAIQNLDELPYPNLDLIDYKKYDSYYAKSYPLTTIIASRGCPFNCSFCVARKTHGRLLRLRSPKNIVDEIEHNYKKYDIKEVIFKDSTFTINKKWVREVCQEIKVRGLKINWCCNTRVDLVDEELLKVMKDSGCHMLLFGIESGSQKVLDMINKKTSVEHTREGISSCKKIGIETAGYFIMGNPGENKEEAEKTIKLSKELGLDYVTFGVTVVYPASDLYNWAVDNNLLKDKYWYMREDLEGSNTGRDVNGSLELKEFPPEEQRKMVKKANRQFYLRPSFMLKEALKFGKYRKAFRAVRDLDY